jgi:hypothetical protein
MPAPKPLTSGSRRDPLNASRLDAVDPAPPETLEEISSPSMGRRVLGFSIGLVLLGVALWVVLANRETVANAFNEAAHAPRWLLVAAIILPIAHWHLTSVVFWLVTRRFGVVRFGEMHLLIGAAGLLNYLPLRPGLFGRIAYHKRVNNIRVKDAVRVTVVCAVLAGIANGLALAVALAAFDLGTTMAWAMVVSPVVVIGAAGFALTLWTKSSFSRSSSLTLALAARYMDTIVWIVRYAVAFELIGRPISPMQATVFAAAAQLAMMVPFVGNGLGVREWAIGLTLPLMEKDAAKTVGLTADLLNRAAEILSAVPIGLVCMAVLARQRHQRKVESR